MNADAYILQVSLETNRSRCFRNVASFGKARAIEIKGGKDLCIISCGSCVYWSLMGAKILKEKHGIDARVIDMHTMKPLDTGAIARGAKETGCVITVEEASINGGLGSAVAEYLCENGFNGKFSRIGLPDEFAVLGDPDEVYKYYGMDPEGIAAKASSMLRGK